MMRGAGLEWCRTGDVRDRPIGDEGRSAAGQIPEQRRLQPVQQLRTLLRTDITVRGWSRRRVASGPPRIRA
ncbi:hypothetical protein CG747_12885 [Streptomyces sp. CB02959]|nr:hypothetical protein CG747_12885 [Streptomyces sp. CB02959]